MPPPFSRLCVRDVKDGGGARDRDRTCSHRIRSPALILLSFACRSGLLDPETTKPRSWWAGASSGCLSGGYSVGTTGPVVGLCCFATVPRPGAHMPTQAMRSSRMVAMAGMHSTVLLSPGPAGLSSSETGSRA